MIPLTSSDPSDIANAARCFSSCVPGTMQSALRTYLLTQAASISTPPCITVTSPVLKGVNFDPNNGGILQVTWSQSANTGSLITGYTVFWGTVSGVYTINSGLLPVTPHQYIINGLNSGTTYFVAVVANTNIAGCQSANSNEKSNTTSGSPPICATGTTFANAWATQVVANGGVAPSQASKDAIANFQCGLITDGLNTLMISWNAFVPDNLIAAITPPLQGPGNTPWTNHNFVLADLTINGLIGDGATKYLDTGCQPQTMWGGVPPFECGMTFYNTTNTGVAAGTNMGCGNGSNTQFCDFGRFNGETHFYAYAVANGLTPADGSFIGYSSANREPASTDLFIYEANSVTPHFLLASNLGGGGTTPVPPFNISVFAFNDNTGPNSFSAERMSFVALHHYLTSAQSAKFFARIQTLRQSLGGGFA